MTEEEIIETVIRYVRLRDELKPVPIWTAEPLAPIDADWVGINHTVLSNSQHLSPKEGFGLVFYRDDGKVVEYLQFDSLDIALDQAKAIAGIELIEWLNCNVSVSENGQLPWSLLLNNQNDPPEN